jgi:ABC-type transport system involved in Fe-S cluster assembly fused permease/ATPase subunit
MQNSEAAAILDAFTRAHAEADALFELAVKNDRRRAVAIAHRLSSSIEAMRLVVESSAVVPKPSV